MLFRSGYIVQNPARNLVNVKVPYRKRKALNMEEVELLREACRSEREKAMFELMVSAGIRAEEVSTAKITDVNWEERTLIVIGKGNKERKVIFSTRTKMFLQNYLRNRKSCSVYLFIASKKPYANLSTRSVEREVKQITARTNIERSVYPHLCRHTFANTSANQNMKDRKSVV